MQKNKARPRFTIGHGSRPLDELIALLKASAVNCLVDVRAFPGSRQHPHFGRAELERLLPEVGTEYAWEGDALGGRRRPRPDSPHQALRNASFRAYADHMQTPGFAAGIHRLVHRGAHERLAVMCAERLPWQCHRYLIADYLVAHGVKVAHLIDSAPAREHHLRSEARVRNGQLIYDRDMQAGLALD